MAHYRYKNTAVVVLGIQAWVLLEAAFFSPRLGPTQQSVGSSDGMPQAKQPEEEHSPTHEQTGCLQSFWAYSCPIITFPDMALPTRWTRPNSAHQWSGTSPFHQEACTRQPQSPGGRQQEKELQHCSLQNRIHNHERQNKTAEKYVPNEGTR